MQKIKLHAILFRAAIAAAVAFSPVVTVAAAPLKAETGSATGLNTIVMQALSKFAKRDLGVDIQVNSGQTLSKTTLSLAKGKLDLTVTPPGAFAVMRQGKGPYKKLGDEAVEASKNLRGLFGFAHGWIHAIVWADSDIKTFSDIKGRKVFTGPPAGAANRESSAVIRIASGYKLDEDYEAVKLIELGRGVERNAGRAV